MTQGAPTTPDARPGPTTGLTTGLLAQTLGAQLIGPADVAITRLETLERGTPGTLTFIRNGNYAGHWAASRASAAMVTKGIEVPGHDPQTRALLIVANADLALNTVLELLAPKPPAARPGVHPAAWVDPAASVPPTVSVGPGCIIEAGASVGDGTVLTAQVYLGRGAKVGRACTLHPGVRIMDHCVIGDACIFHPGVVIGADGFGYRPDPSGRGLIKIPHIGNVEIGPGVEIGANSCIDRAKFGSTTIGAGTKIDNLVQIGHGCTVGRCCLLCAHVALAGSVTLGDGARLGGQAGIADNVTVGKGATLAAQAGVMDDIPAGESWYGFPAYNARQAFRDITLLRKMAAEYRERMRADRADAKRHAQ